LLLLPGDDRSKSINCGSNLLFSVFLLFFLLLLCRCSQLGAHHDRPSLERCDSYESSFNFGYRDPQAEFRTILAYGCEVNQCDNLPKTGCPRIQRFSNTETKYNGKPLGDAANDNARTINESSKVVAAYYPAMDCLADDECDDRDNSTVDTCNTQQRVCVFTPAPSSSSSSSSSPSSSPSSSSSGGTLDAMMEAVVVDGVDEKTWQTVQLQHTHYQDPVIVCSVRYHQVQPVLLPVVVRLTKVTKSSFQVGVQNPSNASNVISRQVHCLVVEAGVWTLPDGRLVEARRQIMTNRTDGKNSWVGIPQSYRHNTYSADPVVLGQVMSYNDPQWSTFWTCGQQRWEAPNATFLTVGLHVGEDPYRERQSEEIGYIVMERGRTTTDASSSGLVVESNRCAVPSGGYYATTEGRSSPSTTTCRFQTAFAPHTTTPTVVTIASQAGMVGDDGSWVVLTSSANATEFGISVDEDQLLDTERVHMVAEQVNYVAVSSDAPIRLTKAS
jgi:hypothetical protein